jgi:hypothetical protein
MFEYDPKKVQATYEAAVLRRLRAEVAPFALSETIDSITERGFRLALRAKRTRTGITMEWLARMPRKAGKDEILQEFEDLRACHPDHTSHALVFDTYGDGMGDLVMHTIRDIDVDSVGWYAGFVFEGVPTYIQPLKDFLKLLNKVYA